MLYDNGFTERIYCSYCSDAVTYSRDVKYKELQSRLGLNKMSNKKYRCPHCEQRSSRRWNLQVHLKRRHQAAGELVSPSQEGSAYGGRPRYRLKSGDGRSIDFNSFSRSDRGWADINGERNPLDDTIENLRRIVEIKRLTEEVNPQYQQHPSFMLQIDYGSINYTEEFLKKLDSMTFTPETDPLRDRIIGLRCHICDMCLSTNPLPLHGFRESRMIVPSHHRCYPQRVANLQGLTGLERRSKVMELYRSSPEAMKKAVHDWWLDGVSPHLIVVPFISAGDDAYESRHSSLRAIDGSQ